MDLKTLIREDLWFAISANYQSSNYTGAISDSLFFLNDLIRDKTGLDQLDGTVLMEKSFFGTSPALKITKLETRTEKDIQEGVGQILKGIMLSIRNPRSHEKHNDSKDTADSIIIFISYILNIVDKAKQPYFNEDWVEYLLTKEIPDSQEYACELLNEIPRKRQKDILIELFRNTGKLKNKKLKNIACTLIRNLNPDEQVEFYDFISGILNNCDAHDEWCGFFYIFSETNWWQLKRLSKLRAEYIVQNSITDGVFGYSGEYDNTPYQDEGPEVLFGGDLAIIASNCIACFDTKEEILKSLYKKLENDDPNHIEYVVRYFQPLVFDFDWNERLKLNFIQGITAALQHHNQCVYEIISKKILLNDGKWKENLGDVFEDTRKYFEEKQDNVEEETGELPF